MLLFWLVIAAVFVLVLVGVAALVYWLIMQARDVPSGTGRQAVVEEDPLELARQRYRRGEISYEEYLVLREDLKV
jgi:uncharacterized membrane protein